MLVEEPVEIRWAPPDQATAGNDGTPALVCALWAARLCGMAQSLREAVGAPLPPVERPTYERTVATGRARLGEAAFNRARTEGRSMSLEQVFSSIHCEMGPVKGHDRPINLAETRPSDACAPQAGRRERSEYVGGCPEQVVDCWL